MNRPVKLSAKDGRDRELYYLFIQDLGEFPSDIELASKNFVLFLACDATDLDVDVLADWSDKLIDCGIAYLCAWGDNCELVHDTMDEIIVGREVFDAENIPPIMTAWHAEDTLDDALWFALFSSQPDDYYSESCNSNLIVVVGNKNWDDQVRLRLSDVNKFNEEFLKVD